MADFNHRTVNQMPAALYKPQVLGMPGSCIVFVCARAGPYGMDNIQSALHTNHHEHPCIGAKIWQGNLTIPAPEAEQRLECLQQPMMYDQSTGMAGAESREFGGNFEDLRKPSRTFQNSPGNSR